MKSVYRTMASLALSSVSSSSCWALRNLAKLRAAISSASSICRAQQELEETEERAK